MTPSPRRSAVLGRPTIAFTVPAVVAALLTAAGPATAAEHAGTPGVGDPYFPLAGNGGYHVAHYGLTLGYDPTSGKLTGKAVLTARATQRLTRFDLDLKGLKITGLTVDRSRAAYRRSGQELVITPRHALHKGQKFRVAVTYQGKPGPVTDPDGSLDGWIPTKDGVFVAGEPQGAMTWFPANNHPLDKSSYDITITVPEGRTAVSNGVLLGKSTRKGKTTFRWRQKEPMAAYLTTATIGKFKVKQYTTHDGIKVYDAVDPRLAKAAAPVLKQLPKVLEWGSKVFGPYPYRAAGSIVDHAPDVGYALETQTRPVYSSAPDLNTLVHESAHQWFGDSVTLTSWKDIWLNEGFAGYAEWLYAEQHGGTSAQRTFDDLYATPARDALWAFPPGNPGSGAKIFDRPVYDRGAMTLHALRTAVGDRVFFRVLRTWATEQRHGHGTTAQFQKLAEQLSGKKLGPLFDKWLYTQGKPSTP
ncbi:M1 family metallopeptidase [Streptomyces scabiei]|uniref:M1 family metallopeptidase n=1 Tax=Streptomyces scabiei TaxID=1930 RepID=UPI0004E76B47|nr:M1 family metallopeptidase [Streptomyces scabiei]MBP5934118.1 M1 family metallopeptidase [Streptomyces sp. LBUM 1479]KFG03796.1 metallopeptidase [Streptomyces scabiei]MDX2533055.1 M1 family metallopeptidase [Streptomyces scabiei]MDX2835353.1 M1 family metallopeptidase [Streptomyces scabiei]MDX3674024.1 M1 family metallopeptidase [Streptomyces scabiei]